MKFLSVGKTVVAHPGKPIFILINEYGGNPVRRRVSLKELAEDIRSLYERRHTELYFIKNDAPSILWTADDTIADTVLECERLSPQELHQLAQLLQER